MAQLAIRGTETPVVRLSRRPGAAMHKYNRFAVRVARFFEVQFVYSGDLETAYAVGIIFGVKGQRYLL